MNRGETTAKIGEIAERVAQAAGIEVLEVELKGAGRHQVLQIVIDKPDGVTHGDCELVSHEVGAILDAEDTIRGTYSLEVSSPGVERKLTRWKDWERFVGQKAKVVLREPMVAGDGQPAAKTAKYFEGVIERAENQSVTLRLADGSAATFPFGQVDRANLKFEW